MTRLQLLGLGLVLLLATAAGGYLVGFFNGKAAAEREHAGDGMTLLSAAVERATGVLADVQSIGARLADALAASRAREPINERRVRDAIQTAPDFGAMRRPADLERLRHEQLDRIEAAARAD